MMIKKEQRKLLISLSVLILIVGIGYAWLQLKRNPHQSSEFESLTVSWGKTDGRVNHYDSQTGVYQFLDSRDSLFNATIKLKQSDIIYLNAKFFELGLWDLPEQMGTNLKSKDQDFFYLQVNYKNQQRKLEIYNNYESKGLELDSALAVKAVVKDLLQTSLERYTP